MEQRARIGDRPAEIGSAVGEADPVRVVEGGGTPERGRQPEHVVKVERTDVQAAAGIGPLRMARQRAHPTPGALEGTGDRGPRVAEGSGHDVEPVGRELGRPDLPLPVPYLALPVP